MPWQIQKDSSLSSTSPVIHYADLSVELHMYVFFAEGIITLFIGQEKQECSNILLHIDHTREEYKPSLEPIRIIRCTKPTHKQMKIIDSVLATLMVDKDTRVRIRKEMHTMKIETDITKEI